MTNMNFGTTIIASNCTLKVARLLFRLSGPPGVINRIRGLLYSRPDIRKVQFVPFWFVQRCWEFNKRTGRGCTHAQGSSSQKNGTVVKKFVDWRIAFKDAVVLDKIISVWTVSWQRHECHNGRRFILIFPDIRYNVIWGCWKALEVSTSKLFQVGKWPLPFAHCNPKQFCQTSSIIRFIC